jgi:hypothetical protein
MNDQLRARAIELCTGGMSAGDCSRALGVTRNAVIGVVYRARLAGVLPQQTRSPDRIAYYDVVAAVPQLCFANECHETATHGKFCDAHRYRPRQDQPLSRLMGARA